MRNEESHFTFLITHSAFLLVSVYGDFHGGAAAFPGRNLHAAAAHHFQPLAGVCQGNVWGARSSAADGKSSEIVKWKVYISCTELRDLILMSTEGGKW